MSSVVNKRQQARNERALQELIRSVPGNDRCADCQARNPGWASWSLGVFLCMRCGSLHRKMGTHISKVKSLSMDSWTSDQVENMKRKGNTFVNKEYNPKNIKPAIPIDADEADSAMERFIRQKYEHRILEDGKPKPPSRDDSGYHTQRSFEEAPSPIAQSSPSLPQKTGRKFGFGLRSVSSTSRLERTTSPSSPTTGAVGSFSASLNKQSRVFGANVGEYDNSVDTKLRTLREMGFPNDKRNASVLKGHLGDLERTVETLMRLGEGGLQNTGSAPSVPSKPSTSASLPTPEPSSSRNPKSAAADDPWSITTTVSSSTGAHINQPDPAPTKSYNPFDAPNPQPAPATGLENSFQNLSVNQPLFPHTTGGYPSQHMPAQTTLPQLQTSQSYTNSPQPLNYNPFFQTTSLAQTANPYFSNSAQSTPIQPTQSLSPGNPFFGSLSAQSTGAQQIQPPSFQGFAPRHANTMPVYPSASMIPQQQQQQHYFESPQAAYNPFNTPNNPTFSPQQQQQQQQVQSQSQQFYPSSQNPYQMQQAVPQSSRMDKNSILALYNLATPASTMSTIPEQAQAQQTPPTNPYQTTSPAPSLLTNSGSTPQTMQLHSPYNNMPTPQRSATMPEMMSPNPPDAATNNPFFNPAQQQVSNNPFPATAVPATAAQSAAGLGIGLGPKQTAPPPSTRNNFMPISHMSKGSVDINGFQNGRHSPDAFASLSARFA
ncbi:hypothetical protein BGW36DRAFT_395400 [Talaromyces proteolyticus]|uniref:Arf-GAP domain-containing protein n=1 Tax=Talaromyces proteolyticus TaxID=1131652 RepID=A0AAD4KZS4_9EURO|nr:uncharacterized protein BGW36DRAFT_395400 [Talaromyces proteolyticus]KAH8700274.1 hypothetical protein BGW36DRAFT_395400 [Talaromyces proteolyticus]